MSVLGRGPKPGYAPGILFTTLAATSKKSGVSFYQYIHDRISGTNLIPPLADLVTIATKELNLGWSFSVA
jgi:hypothetical protein